jgi:hypothetical protein
MLDLYRCKPRLDPGAVNKLAGWKLSQRYSMSS